MELFGNGPLGPGGFHEGERFLGAREVKTDETGNAPFKMTFAEDVRNITATATATDADGNTSEFSIATIVVNCAADDPDANTLDGVCNTGKTAPCGRPECTLRAAIQQANAGLGPVTVEFDILTPGGAAPVIAPSALPTIEALMLLHATTQPGGKVVLDGVGAGTGASGLRITARDSEIKGFAINPGRGRRESYLYRDRQPTSARSRQLA